MCSHVQTFVAVLNVVFDSVHILVALVTAGNGACKRSFLRILGFPLNRTGTKTMKPFKNYVSFLLFRFGFFNGK